MAADSATLDNSVLHQVFDNVNFTNIEDARDFLDIRNQTQASFDQSLPLPLNIKSPSLCETGQFPYSPPEPECPPCQDCPVQTCPECPAPQACPPAPVCPTITDQLKTSVDVDTVTTVALVVCVPVAIGLSINLINTYPYRR